MSPRAAEGVGCRHELLRPAEVDDLAQPQVLERRASHVRDPGELVGAEQGPPARSAAAGRGVAADVTHVAGAVEGEVAGRIDRRHRGQGYPRPRRRVGIGVASVGQDSMAHPGHGGGGRCGIRLGPQTFAVGHRAAAAQPMEIPCPTSHRASPRAPPERLPTPSCFASPARTSPAPSPLARTPLPSGFAPSWCGSHAPTPSRRRVRLGPGRPVPASPRPIARLWPSRPLFQIWGRTGWESTVGATRGARPRSAQNCA